MKIGLGTVQFGTDYGINAESVRVGSSEVKDIIDYARCMSIDLLDTAPAYGDSEQVLGGSNTQDFKVVTKTRHFDQAVISDKEVSQLGIDLEQSLSLLKRKSVYGVLVHNADDLLKPGADKIFNHLQIYKKEGFVSKIGVSVYTSDQLQKIIDRFDIDLVQLPFNILDKRLIDSGILNYIHRQGVEVHARSIFLQGLLLMTNESRPNKFNRWQVLWSTWDQWLQDNNITALEATIRHAISMPEISKVLVGVDSKIQLQEIITAAKGDLPPMPAELHTNDANLLNPSNWNKL